MVNANAPGLLKEWRAAKGLSQEAAAALVGVRQPTWSDWEHARKRPQIEQALKIAEVTDGAVAVEAWRDLDAAAGRTGTEG